MDRKINESPRHSAMALLCLMQFADWLVPAPDFTICRDTARWLLSSRHTSAGWAFVPAGDLELISTAAAIAALCVFRKRFSTELDKVAEFCRAVEDAIRTAFQCIIQMRGQSIWNDLSPRTQVADSAFIIELLCLALTQGGLCELGEHYTTQVSEAAKGLWHCRTHQGWPARSGGQEASPLATIFGLRTTLIAASLNMIPDGGTNDRPMIQLDVICRAMILRKQMWQDLKIWDWIQIARLSNAVLLGGRDSELSSVARRIGDLTRSSARLNLTRQQVRTFPKYSREALLYLLTYGRPDAVPSGWISQKYVRLPAVLRLTIESVPGAAVGYLLGRLL
jgi:hypothetical protein